MREGWRAAWPAAPAWVCAGVWSQAQHQTWKHLTEGSCVIWQPADLLVIPPSQHGRVSSRAGPPAAGRRHSGVSSQPGGGLPESALDTPPPWAWSTSRCARLLIAAWWHQSAGQRKKKKKNGKKKKQERRSSLATGAASPNNFIKARRHLLAGGGVLEEINIHEQIGAAICQHHNRCYQFVCERQLKYCKWIKAKVSRVATERVSATSLRSEPMASKSCEKSHSFFFSFLKRNIWCIFIFFSVKVEA